MKVSEALLYIENSFLDAGFINNFKQESKWILSFILNSEVSKIALLLEIDLSQNQFTEITRIVKLRASGYPLDYIIGNKDFWKYNFVVTPGVLIPRLDTEVLIQAVLKFFPNHLETYNIIDIGTGSACIVISLLKEYINSTAIATDISKDALAIAQINAKKLHVTDRLDLINTSIVEDICEQTFDIIVSNPPYIDINDPEVDINVRKYEPNIALFAPNNGLYFYEMILKDCKSLLSTQGKIFFEIGYSQKLDIVHIANKYGYFLCESLVDSFNKDRVLVFQHN